MKAYRVGPVFLFFLFFLNTNIQGHIIEHDCIAEVARHLEQDKKNLVIFDIDNTIAEPYSDLGSDQWFNHIVTVYQKRGFSDKDAFKTAVKLYHHLHTFLDMQPVEAETPTFINSLQKQKIPVLALTARSFIERTFEQLGTIAIDFAHTAVSDGVFDLTQQNPAFYQNGIIFSGNNDKGRVLCAFFDRTGYQPDKIVFVDDKESNIASVERAVEARGIQFIGIRYSRLDKKVKALNITKAQEQLTALLAEHPFPTPPYIDIPAATCPAA